MNPSQTEVGRNFDKKYRPWRLNSIVRGSNVVWIYINLKKPALDVEGREDYDFTYLVDNDISNITTCSFKW